MDKERYQKRLYELGICCTGVSFTIIGGAASKYEKQPEKRMQYCVNSGVIAFVDEYGDTYLVPYTGPSMESLLKATGYTEGIFNVPRPYRSNVVDNDSFISKWEALEKNASQDGQSEKLLAELMDYDIRRISKLNGVKKLPENVYEFSIDMDSLSYDDGKGNVQTLPKTYLKYDEVLKTANTGIYNISNGIIVFIDERGKTFFAPTTPYIEEELKNCGYKLDSSLAVPFANGEKIVKDDAVARKFERLKEISKRFVEDKEYEDLYILLSDKYERLTIDSRVLDDEIRSANYGLRASERNRKSTERELQKLKMLHEEISTLLNTKKVISRKELRSIISKYGTMTEDGFKLYEEDIKEENVEEQVDMEQDEPKKVESDNLANISERDRVIRQQLQAIADRSRLQKIEPILHDWLINLEGLQDDKGNTYTSYLKYNALTRENNIGTYSAHSGVVVIIDTDGQTYIAPYNSRVKTALINANFSERNMAVPFSNREKIANNDELKNRFEKLCKISERKLETENVASNKGIDRLEDKYVEVSRVYTARAKKVDQKKAQLKFKKQTTEANYDKTNKCNRECQKYCCMVEDLLNQCKNRLAMSAKKVEERMDSHDLSSEEEMTL